MFVKAMPIGALLLFLKRYQVSDKKGLKAISLQCVTDNKQIVQYLRIPVFGTV